MSEIPIDLNIEADAYRTTLIPRADVVDHGSPLWHGWAIFDAYVAGVIAERNRAAARIEALAARVAKLETLLKAARQVSEAAEGIYIEVSDQEAEHLRVTFGELDAALAALGEAVK